MMDFPHDIGSMTLAQAKEYCRNYRLTHKGYCEKVGSCELGKRNICNNWVHEWDFDLLTPEELEICKAVGAKWVTKDNYTTECFVYLWAERPDAGNNGNTYGGVKKSFGKILGDLFPTVKPGGCICVEDLIKEAENEEEHGKQ